MDSFEAFLKKNRTPTSAIALDLFDKFSAADSLSSTLTLFRHLCNIIKIKPTNFSEFFACLKENLTSSETREFLAKFEEITSQKCYEKGTACEDTRVLIIGMGPIGLRMAIEAQLLGAKVVIIERRESFTRNNVLHLWPWVITDLKKMGAKKFYGKFCSGAIDHISISKLQLILLKIALLLGVQIYENVEFVELIEPKNDSKRKGWKASFVPEDHPVSNYVFDVLVGAAGGRRIMFDGFNRKLLRGKIALAITANFVYHHTKAEAGVKEISGVSYVFKQGFFDEMAEKMGIDLENIVYYKDETHYIVMTAKKFSLLYRGVLKDDFSDTKDLLAPTNIDMDCLKEYVTDAVTFSTNGELTNLEFSVTPKGHSDVALIDFTEMYQAEHSCRVLQRNGVPLLLALVGDSLIQPFWPTGTGIGRGFLSALDTAWTIRNWSKRQNCQTILEIIAEREYIYRNLPQTTPENLSKEHKNYNADPHSRYINLNLNFLKPHLYQHLYDRDSSEDIILNENEKNGHKNESEKAKSSRQIKKIKRTISQTASDDINTIIDWLNSHIKQYGINVCGVHNLITEGTALLALLHRFRPDLIPEFPFPDDIEEGLEEEEAAAFKNQLVFDFLHEEYNIPPPSEISKSDPSAYASENICELTDYMAKIYDVFKNELPMDLCQEVKAQIFSGTQKPKEMPNGNDLYNTMKNASVQAQNQKNEEENDAKKEKAANFLCSEKLGNNSARIQKLAKKLQNSCSNSSSLAKSTSNAEFQTEMNELMNLNISERQKRLKEAEETKAKAIKLIKFLNQKKEEGAHQKKEEMAKAIKMLENNNHETEDKEKFSTMQSDDFFNHYNMRLYRSGRPSINDRKQNLETKLSTLTNSNGLKKTDSNSNVTINGISQNTKNICKILEEKEANKAKAKANNNLKCAINRSKSTINTNTPSSNANVNNNLSSINDFLIASKKFTIKNTEEDKPLKNNKNSIENLNQNNKIAKESLPNNNNENGNRNKNKNKIENLGLSFSDEEDLEGLDENDIDDLLLWAENQ